MIVIIEDRYKIIKQKLDKLLEYKGIVIYYDSYYYITLKNNYFFDDETKTKKVELQSYRIINTNSDETINLYFYNDDESFNKHVVKDNTNFIYSSNPDSSIISYDPYINNHYLILRDEYLESDANNIILNGNAYNGERLKDGDHVQFISFSFYYYKKFIYFSSFLTENRLKTYTVERKIFKYKNDIPLLNNYYEETKKELKIDKLESFNYPRKTNSRKLFLQLGPTLTMSLAMIMLASINVYNSYIEKGINIGILSLLLMPVTMLISGILWPVVGSISDRRSYKKEFNLAKKEYINYLKEYDGDLSIKIKEYISEENKYYFDYTDILNKLFYISSSSNNFMHITLGYQTKQIDYDYHLTKDKDIDEHINRIVYRLNNINNCPLFLNLRENKYVTIITKNREYYLNKIFLELISKYHYDDLSICIYSKDEKIFNDIFYIPHLFINNTRLTLTNERQLFDINNYKLDKPLILLMNEYSEFCFTNKNIHCIYFSSSKESILKNSNCIVDINNNNGILISKTKIQFTTYLEDINFKKYYDYISKFQDNKSINQIKSFNDINPNISVEQNYLVNRNGLRANFGLVNNDILAFDLHESKDGPHGLIGGSTGSGKSELIISLLLSLCLRYSPEYLNIILIDYKGGGIKDSLSYNSVAIPHIIADISNLEADTFERLIVAIGRECKKRQLLFKKLSILASTSIMNIDDYLDINKEYKLENIAHLLIVVDEFAELKKENPTIIKELISFSRIGRSLGIHLILATQRPNGVVDDEIWSNSHFKIALKVHSEKDSVDIIKDKKAAYLNNPGEFYLQVDDNTIKAKSLYTKKDINNNDQYEVSILDNKLEILSKKILKKNNPFLESSYYSKMIIDVTNKLKINTNEFEFEKPNEKYRKDLENIYNSNNNMTLGEKDDYLNAHKDILNYSLDENILIYSSRNREINNILNITNENKLQTIIISNIRYKGEYISDSLLYEDEEDIKYLFSKLLNDINTRLNLIIEDINVLISYDDEYINYIFQLIRRSNVSKYKLILLTKQSNINFKLLNSIKNKVVIELFDNQELIDIYGMKGEYKGKSFFFNETPITFVPCLIEEYIEKQSILIPYIDTIPQSIEYESNNSNLLIGYYLVSRSKVYISNTEILLITSYDNELLKSLSKLFINNQNVIIKTYSDDLLSYKYNSILWIGDSLYSQRLFYVEKDITLSKDEGYLFRFNKGSAIRYTNHE